MAFDGFFTQALALELNSRLKNHRVEKINCRGNSAEFSLYGDKTKKYLLLSLSASANFVALTESPTLANDAPSTFCLLLRKHLSAGKIREISAVEDERIIKFVFDSPDELGHISEKTLYAEIMGRYSNVVVTSGNKVLGSLYYADLVSYKRAIMPGFDYELPPKQDKISARTVDFDTFSRLAGEQKEKSADKFLLDTFLCFSPLTSWETVYRAAGNGDALLKETNLQKLFDEVKGIYSRIESMDFCPTAVYENGTGKEFLFEEIHRYGNMECRHFSSLSELCFRYFGEKESKNLLKERTSDLMSVVNARLKRIEKKEALQNEELNECAKKDEYRIQGELITANMFKIRQGDSECMCTDWETGREIKVKLDVRLSPSANAAKLFKKYRKLKSAEEIIREQLEISNGEKQYLLSVVDAINRSESGDDADQIKEELISGGYIRKSSKKTFQKPAKPIEYTTSGGFSVRVGRNNIMNDALTKSAGKDDIWFHVKAFSGSHTILYTNGIEPGDADYTEAAEIAAKHSSIRDAETAEVDYTRVRYVHKPVGSKPGFVTYDKYYTCVVKKK